MGFGPPLRHAAPRLSRPGRPVAGGPAPAQSGSDAHHSTIDSGTALHAFDIEGSTIFEARVVVDHVPNPTVNEIFRELVLLRDENDLTWLLFD